MTYIFTNIKTNKSIERKYSVGKAPRKFTHKGRIFHRDIAAEHRGASDHDCSIWPKICDASGVGHDQIAEARQESIDNGVPTDFVDTGPMENRGQAILRNPIHAKRYWKSIGLRDRSAYY